MQRYNIPTAGYAVFTDPETAGEYLAGSNIIRW